MALELDYWVAETVSRHLAGRPDACNITLPQAIKMYTRDKLQETLEYARENSPFYREKLAIPAKPGEGFSDGMTYSDGLDRTMRDRALADIPGEGDFLKEFEKLPFTTEDDLKDNEMDMLCVRPSEINRIVTLRTSGTTGTPKRIYFTEEDQQLTVDYFNRGMRLIVDETDKVLILMPCGSEGSIGRLLGQGLRDLGAETIEYGTPFRSERHSDERLDKAIPDEQISKQEISPAKNAEESKKILDIIREKNVTSIVATPTHMVAISRALQKDIEAGAEEIYLRSILLSAEFVPDKTTLMLEELFQCTIFEHYGMTEMGLGCAVSCGYGRGYHIRETDLYVELINPVTGQVVRGEGKNTPGFSNYGEVVFTTLTRKGMPFIRYRTGDFSRWILEPCPCGSCLKRLDKVVPGERKG